jgi:poly(3-hydroxyalkanoate) depolymerase
VTTTIRVIEVDGHAFRVGIKAGDGTPLLLFNGIGANLELLEPLTHALGGIETIVFDLPGVGGTPPRMFPYRMRSLARSTERMLEALGYRDPVDVLGVSWGGALAQQFAFTCANRCRKLVLVATTPGVLMVPGSLFAMARLFNLRRYADPSHLQRIAPQVYGGAIRSDPRLMQEYAARMKSPHWLGYLYEQLAFWGWTSLPWLALLPQPTLILSGNDDPLVPVLNARILAALIPHAQLKLVDDGHLFLLTNPSRVVPFIRDFLAIGT